MIRAKTALLQVFIAAAFMAIGADDGWGQERPAKRVADIVGVALAEYEKGIDASGQADLAARVRRGGFVPRHGARERRSG